MKAMRKILATALAAVVAVTCVVPVYAADPKSSEIKPGQETVDSDNQQAETTNTGLDIMASTSSNGTAKLESIEKTNKKNVKVPSKLTVNGVKYTVTTIGADTFANCKKMKNATIPASVTKIAKGAFKEVNMKKAQIKGDATLKKGAFKNAVVKTLELKGEATIEKGAFKGAAVNKLVISRKATVKKGAFNGMDTKKMVIKVTGKMTKSQFKAYKAKMKAAGFQGTVKRA